MMATTNSEDGTKSASSGLPSAEVISKGSDAEDRTPIRRPSSRRLLRRTSTEYFGDISRALLPGPPRLVTKWMKQATKRKTVKQTLHSTNTMGSRQGRFTSQHHDGYVWPIHDVAANELLMWLLPTHMLTHVIKFSAVLLSLLFGVLFCTLYERTYYQVLETEEDASIFTDTTMATPLILFQKYWPSIVAGLCFLGIPTWIYWMYQTTFFALGKPWMDPRLPAVNRLEMHVPMRFYTSVKAARQGACHIEMVSRDTAHDSSTIDSVAESKIKCRLPKQQEKKSSSSDSPSDGSIAPNVLNLDGSDWKFQLLPTVEEGLNVVYRDELLNGDILRSNKGFGNKSSVHEYEWSDMVVPSNWMFRNGEVPFDKPIYTNQKYPFPCCPPIVPRDNPTGVYRKSISLPEEWVVEDGSERAEYTLLLHGIESACFVYWNGELVGFCKDSRLPSEFAIPEHNFLQLGDDGGIHASFRSKLTASTKDNPYEHVLHLVVARWSDGSYVEDQDHWWMAGVHRSVELIRRPAGADLMDFKVIQANHHGELQVDVVARGPKSRPQHLQRRKRYIKLSLFHDSQYVFSKHAIEKDSDIGDRGSSCWGPADAPIWSETQSISNENFRTENLDDKDDREISITASTNTNVIIHFETLINNPQLWTAETPNLYTLVIEQHEEIGGDANDRDNTTRTTTTQVESCRIGFRSVEVTSHGILHVNGRPITICGINRHEHDPDHGKVVSLDRMKQDVIVLKKNNFNSIRLSHYPNHISFYRLCDYYGMYVCDEANIETHGMKPMGRLAQDWGWENTFVSRIRRMVQRDINHACIIFWSLGNEAGRGRNMSLSRKLVLDLDSTRPVAYESGGSWAEGVGRTELTDIVCPMYPDVTRTIHMGRRDDEDRPVILCEYSHSMNNSNGNLHLYWEAFWNPDIPRLQGGFIWDMLDQGLRKKSDKGVKYFGYGGDFGDTINDAQFCINGMFTPDREPHPAVHELKFLQQPADLAVNDKRGQQDISLDVFDSSIAPLELQLQNRYSFRDLSHIEWSWQLMCDRSTEPLMEGIAPAIEQRLLLDFSERLNDIHEMNSLKNSKFDCMFYLNVEGRLSESQTWSEAGHVIVSKQFLVRFNFRNKRDTDENSPIACQTYGPLAIEEDERTISVLRGGNIPMVTIAKATGSIVSINWNEQLSLISGGNGITPNLTRPTTDNDRGGIELVLDFMCLNWATPLYKIVAGFREFSYEHVWDSMGLSQSAPPRVVCERIGYEDFADQITVTASCSIESRRKKKLFTQVMTYDVYRNGNIRISCQLVPQRSIRSIPSLARVGLRFMLDPCLSKIQYFGRGSNENYADRKLGSWMGIWETSPSDMGFDYIVPQENGSRSDCEWVGFQPHCSHHGDEDGIGMLVVAEPGSNFSFSALLHSQGELHHASHSCDLDQREDGYHPVYVTIDHKLMGLGGDVSWFPRVYPQFLVKPEEYDFSIWLIPLQKDKCASVEARKIEE